MKREHYLIDTPPDWQDKVITRACWVCLLAVILIVVTT